MKVIVMEDGNAFEFDDLEFIDEKIIVTRFGNDDYDVYFDDDDCSVRGTFSDVVSEIINAAREKKEAKNA